VEAWGDDVMDRFPAVDMEERVKGTEISRDTERQTWD
jgi:hypothetical protein